jgi:hypothetical protein
VVKACAVQPSLPDQRGISFLGSIRILEDDILVNRLRLEKLTAALIAAIIQFERY